MPRILNFHVHMDIGSGVRVVLLDPVIFESVHLSGAG